MTPPVATVAGRPILLASVEQRIEDLRRGPRGRQLPPSDGPGSRDLRRWIVRELVTEAILVHEAQARGLPEPGRLVAAVTGDVQLAEDDLRAYYRRNADLYRRPEARIARHVVLGDADAASTIAWTGVALTEFRRGELVGPFEDALFAAESGAIVGPIRTEHGWHVARVEAVIFESLIPYEHVRDSIAQELLSAARVRAFDDWLERRRRELAVIEPAWEHPADPIHGRPSHRH